MPCSYVPLEGGGFALVKHGAPRAQHPCASCGRAAGYQCDWKIGGGKTCDTHLCRECALQVDTDKDLCPEHAREYEAWKKAREAKPNAAQELPRV